MMRLGNTKSMKLRRCGVVACGRGREGPVSKLRMASVVRLEVLPVAWLLWCVACGVAVGGRRMSLAWHAAVASSSPPTKGRGTRVQPGDVRSAMEAGAVELEWWLGPFSGYGTLRMQGASEQRLCLLMGLGWHMSSSFRRVLPLCSFRGWQKG
jgi:hypothetical protein